MEATPLNPNQRLTSIRYADMETLLEREEYMKQSLQNYLDRRGNQEYIEDTSISVADDYYFINFLLTKI